MTASQVNGMPGAFPPPPPPSVPTAPPQQQSTPQQQYGNPYDSFNYQNGQQTSLSFDYSNSMPAVSASNLYSNYLPQMSSPLLNTSLDNQQSQGVNPPQNPPHTNPASPSAILSETKQI